MKNLIFTFLLTALLAASVFSQNGERLEAWAENVAFKFERLAERVAEDVERSAENFEEIAEDIADDIEEKFDNGEFDVDINVDGWGDGRHYQHHSKAYLGIHSDHISKRKAEKLGFQNRHGSYITRVVKNSAADIAGLRPFDYIYGVEDQRTSDNQDLSDILADYEPGESVKVHYVRNGQARSVNVELGEYDDFDWNDRKEEKAFLGVSKVNDRWSDDMDGVKVNVVNNSSAEDIGMEDGDVIKSINGQPILDWDDISTAINNLAPGEQVQVEVERDGRAEKLSGKIESKEYDDYEAHNKESKSWDWNDDGWDVGGGAFLGVYIEGISQRKAEALGFDNPYGSYVSGIIEGTAADKAGMKPFDYIFGIDEYRVGEHQNLGGILRKYEAGDEAVVHFYRKASREKRDIIFRARPDYDKKEHKNKCEDPFLGIIEMERRSGQEGVRIKPVRNSTAEEIGLEESDVVTHINGYKMYDWTDIGIAIDMLSPGDEIDVDFVRDGNSRKASSKIMSYAEAKNCDDCDCGDNDFVIINPNDFKMKIPRSRDRWDSRDHSHSRMNVESMDVDMEDVSNAEARELESKGIDMTISNDLRVENLKLGPNPNIGMFELQFDIETEGETMVKVYNPSGRAIYEYDLGRFSGDFSDYIDISQNGEGTYFLQVSQDGKSFVRKVVLKKN